VAKVRDALHVLRTRHSMWATGLASLRRPLLRQRVLRTPSSKPSVSGRVPLICYIPTYSMTKTGCSVKTCDFVSSYCCGDLSGGYHVTLYKVGVFGEGTASFGPMLGVFHQHISPKHMD